MKKEMGAKAFKLMIAGLFAISATIVPVTASFAAGESLGAPMKESQLEQSRPL
jgi:hypothetical protein